MDIDALINEMSGIRLDVGCGAAKQEGFVGMDVRELPGVEIVHDVNVIPWPLPDECVLVAICSHLVEHIPPVVLAPDGSTRFPFMEFMDEFWRVMKPGGKLAISHPHGSSQGFLMDPTHVNPCNEATWAYFDPSRDLYGFYKPKPWEIKELHWNPAANVEVLLMKRQESENEDDGSDS